MSRARWLATLTTVAFAVTLGACSETSQVGNGDLVRFTPAPDATASPSPATGPTTGPANPAPAAGGSQGSSTASQGAKPKASPTTIKAYALSITASGYTPNPLHIPAGATVRFFNQDTSIHTWTEDKGVWDSKDVAAGKYWDYVASRAGDYFFHDAKNGSLTGELQVG